MAGEYFPHLLAFGYGFVGELTQARPEVVLNTIKLLVKEKGWPLEKALPLCTKNTGDFLSLKKGGVLLNVW